MTVLDLLPETCGIFRKTLNTSGKTDTESWSLLETVSCRVLKRGSSKANLEKTQYATVVSTRFVLPLSCRVAIRDRVDHGGRQYDVVEVVTTYRRTTPSHLVAICEVFAGGV